MGVGLLVAVGATVSPARAQDTPAEPEARTTGLPRTVEWTFHFDATWGAFGFASSLFQNPGYGMVFLAYSD
jgi:hypothetical protein